MSSNEHDRVLEALNVLCNVPNETLQSLRTQVPLAFQKLQALVGNSSLLQDTNRFSPSGEAQRSTIPFTHSPSSSSTILNITDTSSSPSSIHLSSSPPSADGDLLPKSISSLIEALNKDSEKIEAFLSKSEFEDTRDELERIIEDPRVVDLQLDRCHQSDKVKFRKGLSQRSLAIEYSHWEHCTYNSSRVSELAEDLSTAQETNAGHIEEYINLNSHRFINTQVTRTGIEHGIKMLVLERLLGQRAISAILSFKYRRFRAVKFKDLDSLERDMKRTEWIMELVKKKADWLDGCQNQYDAWCSAISRRKGPREPSPESSRKRGRLDQAVTPLGSPSENQRSHYQSTSGFGNQNSTTAWERSNNGGEAEPRINSMPHFNFATLAKANPPPLPSENSAYHYNLTTLPPEISAHDPAVPAQANSTPLPQETTGCSYDLALLAIENPPSLYQNLAYEPAVQANSTPLLQETTGCSFDLTVFAIENLPSLQYENSAFEPQANSTPLPQETTGYSFDLAALAKEPYPYDPFAVSPQPPSLNV